MNPYLSWVMEVSPETADDEFWRRLQISLNVFLAQSRSHRMAAEVVIAEMEERSDGAQLAQKLEWPVETDWCEVRFASAPGTLSQGPLQRALADCHGEYVLAAPVGTVLNDELFRFLAARSLEPNVVYRIGCHEVDRGIPLWTSARQQLRYCEDHGGRFRPYLAKASVRANQPELAGLGFADNLALWTRRRLPMVHRTLAPVYRTVTGRAEPVQVAEPGAFEEADAGEFALMHRDLCAVKRDDSLLREETLAEPMRCYFLKASADSLAVRTGHGAGGRIERWCHGDPLSPSRLVASAEALAVAPPLSAYPEWRFDVVWNSPDETVRGRRAVWEASEVSSRPVPVVCPWLEGTRLELDLRTEITRQIFVGLSYEPNEFYWLSQVLRPGMVFLDAGANVGLYSIFAAVRVGPQGRVVAIEPSVREHATLARNVELNGFSQVTLKRVALGDREGVARLHVASPDQNGLNSLGEIGVSNVALAGVETVPVSTIDLIAQELELSRLDVVKADIEGFESAMLVGARATLRRFRPLLLIEVSERSLANCGSSALELCRSLRALGYQLHTLNTATGEPHPVPDDLVSFAGAMPPGGANLICVPDR